MTDIIRTQGQGVPPDMSTKYRDMGDGTHAEVVALAGGDGWTITYSSDEGNNDIDKSLQTPAGKVRQILWVWVELTTTGTAGNRQIQLQVLDSSDDVILALQTGIVQAASLTRNYLLAPGSADMTAFRDTAYLTTPIPPTLLVPGGFKLRIHESKLIDANNDDMQLHVMYAERAA